MPLNEAFDTQHPTSPSNEVYCASGCENRGGCLLTEMRAAYGRLAVEQSLGNSITEPENHPPAQREQTETLFDLGKTLLAHCTAAKEDFELGQAEQSFQSGE